MTLARKSSETAEALEKTRETVATETFANLATSFRVGLCPELVRGSLASVGGCRLDLAIVSLPSVFATRLDSVYTIPSNKGHA